MMRRVGYDRFEFFCRRQLGHVLKNFAVGFFYIRLLRRQDFGRPVEPPFAESAVVKYAVLFVQRFFRRLVLGIFFGPDHFRMPQPERPSVLEDLSLALIRFSGRFRGAAIVSGIGARDPR